LQKNILHGPLTSSHVASFFVHSQQIFFIAASLCKATIHLVLIFLWWTCHTLWDHPSPPYNSKTLIKKNKLGSHYDQILQGLSSKLEATSKGYMLESYCRTRNIDMNNMIQPVVRRSPKVDDRPPPTKKQAEQNQVDHDHRIAEKKLALEQIRLERAKVAHQQEQLKVHKVLDNGAILMKDGSVKKGQEQSPPTPEDEAASKAVDAPQSPPRTDPDAGVPPTPSPSPDPA
jgi:hypothetical protein